MTLINRLNLKREGEKLGLIKRKVINNFKRIRRKMKKIKRNKKNKINLIMRKMLRKIKKTRRKIKIKKELQMMKKVKYL